MSPLAMTLLDASVIVNEAEPKGPRLEMFPTAMTPKNRRSTKIGIRMGMGTLMTTRGWRSVTADVRQAALRSHDSALVGWEPECGVAGVDGGAKRE